MAPALSFPYGLVFKPISDFRRPGRQVCMDGFYLHLQQNFIHATFMLSNFVKVSVETFFIEHKTHCFAQNYCTKSIAGKPVSFYDSVHTG